MKEESDNVARKRAVAVKEAMQHAWSNYKQYAWGSDVLLPRSKKSKDNWGGMGVTLVDSLGESAAGSPNQLLEVSMYVFDIYFLVYFKIRFKHRLCRFVALGS